MFVQKYNDQGDRFTRHTVLTALARFFNENSLNDRWGFTVIALTACLIDAVSLKTNMWWLSNVKVILYSAHCFVKILFVYIPLTASSLVFCSIFRVPPAFPAATPPRRDGGLDAPVFAVARRKCLSWSPMPKLTTPEITAKISYRSSFRSPPRLIPSFIPTDPTCPPSSPVQAKARAFRSPWNLRPRKKP